MARKYTAKHVKIKGVTYNYTSFEDLKNVYEQIRPIYNEGLINYGKGRARYQMQNVGKKSYTYLNKQVRTMARRINTGVYEQTGGQFKTAFLNAMNTMIEISGDYLSDEVFALVEILDKMHHTQFTHFYNSLSKTDRSILFDTDVYYLGDGSNASDYASKTIEKIMEYAKTHPKVQKIIDEVLEEYPSIYF